jgi:transcriptional regulator NrdR family protein
MDTNQKKGICPYCGSNEIQYTDIFHYDDEDKDEVEKKCVCEKCGKHFTEVYTSTYRYTNKDD